MSVFLNYEGIKGESADRGHKEWIDVETWKWGTHRQITSASSTKGDRESSNARIVDLIITKKMDSGHAETVFRSVLRHRQNRCAAPDEDRQRRWRRRVYGIHAEERPN
ncbi:MAG: type VI secretion system tube protein Hcp [Gammaproteobacteria bacterium]|nr:type VI secretion system tube protein Hcp [Gammaproteobacteria bacterium]